MIRVTLSKYSRTPEELQALGEFPEQKVIEYPGCDGAMPFAGVPGMTAIVRINKQSPQDGPHEVVAVLDTRDIENIQEVPDEGQS